MVLCPRKNKLSKKYTHDKVEIMLALFFEKWKSVDKLWCLWTNYGRYSLRIGSIPIKLLSHIFMFAVWDWDRVQSDDFNYIFMLGV